MLKCLNFPFVYCINMCFDIFAPTNDNWFNQNWWVHSCKYNLYFNIICFCEMIIILWLCWLVVYFFIIICKYVLPHICRMEYLSHVNDRLTNEKKKVFIDLTPFIWMLLLDIKVKINRTLLSELYSSKICIWIKRRSNDKLEYYFITKMFI